MPESYLTCALRLRGEAYLKSKEFSEALVDATATWNKSVSLQGKFPYSNLSGGAALLLAKIYQAQHRNDESLKWASIAYHQLQGSVGSEHPGTLEAKKLVNSLQTIH